MLRNVVETIVRTASNFEHISILQGTKIYGVHLHPIPIPARERDARKDHANFFFDHEDYVREMGAQHGFNYTALRPQLVTGPTPGALNVLPAIGVYAAIRREKGEPFGFPGGPSFVWEAADADLVADAMVWAAKSPQAANEAFNITNGDVFEWRKVWPALAETLGVEPGPDMPTSVAAYLQKNADVWGQIVTKYELRSRNLRELVGQGDQHADFAFAYGAPEGPRAFVSTIKLRQARFTKTIDTDELVPQRAAVPDRPEAPCAQVILRARRHVAYERDRDENEECLRRLHRRSIVSRVCGCLCTDEDGRADIGRAAETLARLSMLCRFSWDLSFSFSFEKCLGRAWPGNFRNSSEL